MDAYLTEMIPFVVLTVGSFVPCLYYGFYCEPVLQICYLCTIAVVGAGWYCLLISVHLYVACHLPIHVFRNGVYRS